MPNARNMLGGLWSDEDFSSALDENWMLWQRGDNLTIEHNDTHQFSDPRNEERRDFVHARAAEGSPLHIKAVAILLAWRLGK